MKKTAQVFLALLLCIGLTHFTLAQEGQAPEQNPKPKKSPVPQAVPAPSAPRALPEAQIPRILSAPQPIPEAELHPVALRASAPQVQLNVPAAPDPLPEAAPQPSPSMPQQPDVSPAPQQMRKEVVKVNYINAREAFEILMPYKSVRGRIQHQRNRNTLIIEDTPDFVEKLLSILKEIDVKPVDLMFTVDVIMGSVEEESGEPLPGSDRLLKELKSLLKYTYFTRLDTTLIKVQDNGRSSQRMGGQGIGLMLELFPRHIRDGREDGIQLELSLRQTTRRHKRRDEQGNWEYFAQPLEKSLSLLGTTLSLKGGQRSVVGVSKLNGGDTALILVIEGKIMK